MPELTLPGDAPSFDDLLPFADLGLDPDPDAEAAMIARLTARLEEGPPTPAARRRVPRLRRPGRGRWNLGTVAATLGVLVVGTAAATAAVGIWDPPLGDDNGRPTVGTTDVPAAQLARFGVLRRPATAADRDASVRRALTFLRPSVEGVRTDRIRVPAGQGPAGVVLVPVERAVTQQVDDALCIVIRDAQGNTSGCWDTAQILSGEATLQSAAVPSSGRAPGEGPIDVRPGANGVETGLVPDGVATVSVAGRSYPVRDNVFSVPTERDLAPPVVWRARDGTEVPQD